MGLKPDHWIRKMAQEHGMIEPFADRQVRKGVISYGVSSYGYDIRVADEFKIFTNVYSAVVDPKHFDTRSMVDFKGEVCVIPPNSFALGRTIEYFRIPRKVLTVCLGKCVTGDTRVIDADTGESLPAAAFVAEARGRTIALTDGGLQPTRVAAHLDNGIQPVFALTTRAGLQIRTTASHPFLTEGGWTPLRALSPGDRIAAAGSCPVFGAGALSAREARSLGWALVAGAFHQVPGPVFAANRRGVRAFLQALFSAAGRLMADGGRVRLVVGVPSVRAARDVRHLLLRFGVFARLEATDGYRLLLDEPARLARFARVVGCLPGSRQQGALEEAVARLGARPREAAVEPISSPPPAAALARTGTRAAPVAGRTPLALGPAVARGADAPGAPDVVWDAVERVEPAGRERVYDLTVPGAHNFIANDLVVHNSTYARCGIIVNVTPFEPEWEGYVTLEISNTTPLPARIYANEGIAQVLFFEADEECEVSYADKKGKYQKQKSIVLPKL